MGKWTDITRGMPVVEEQNQDRRKQIEEEKKKFIGLSSAELAAKYKDIREDKDQKEKDAKKLGLKLEAIEIALYDSYEADGITSLKIEGRGSVRIQPEPYPNVTDKGAYRKWCIANGHEEEMVLPWQTTRSIVKACLMEGQPEPDGVSVFVKRKVVSMKERD